METLDDQFEELLLLRDKVAAATKILAIAPDLLKGTFTEKEVKATQRACQLAWATLTEGNYPASVSHGSEFVAPVGES